jgi:hypothetical protein
VSIEGLLRGQAKSVELAKEQASFERDFRPKHARDVEQFSDEWFKACDAAFRAAMEANPTVRPSKGALPLNSVGSYR